MSNDDEHIGFWIMAVVVVLVGLGFTMGTCSSGCHFQVNIDSRRNVDGGTP